MFGCKRAGLTALLLTAALQSTVDAQHRVARFEVRPPLQPVFLMQSASASTGRMVVGGVLGGGVGLLAGGLVGAVIGNDENDPEHGWVDALLGSVIGATIGESLGLATGVHLGGRRQGNLLLETSASLLIGGIGAVLAANNQDPPLAPIILVATPLGQLAAAIALERR